MQLVAVAICFVIIDKVGRRPLAIYGAVGMTTVYVIMTALVGIYGDNWTANGAAGWACVAMAVSISKFDLKSFLLTPDSSYTC